MLTTDRGTALRRIARLALTSSARWWRRLAVGHGRDGTGMLDGRRLLVLSPHPDDETFGCGAAIARAAAAGTPVTVVVATDGRHSASSVRLTPDRLADLRTGELRTACRHLGVPDGDLIQWGYEDGTLSEHSAALTAAIEDVLVRHRPDVVMFPCAQDSHPDHQALHAAARRAVAAVAPASLMLAYPVWSWHEAPWFLGSAARHRPGLVLWALRHAAGTRLVRIPAGPHLAAKKAAVAAYVTQTTNFTGEDSWSHLSAEFQSAFLHPAEVFVPVPPRRTARSRA
jgi:LmbE family N-acetylglucosaminyl deacetylase